LHHRIKTFASDSTSCDVLRLSLERRRRQQLEVLNLRSFSSSIPSDYFLPSTSSTLKSSIPPTSKYFSTASQNDADNNETLQRTSISENVARTIAELQSKNPYDDALARLPDGAQLHLDFFGEPVTFLGADRPSVVSHRQHKDTLSSAIASLDGFLVGIASKGKSFTGGGEEYGLSTQAAHSAALAWSDLLRYAALWNEYPSDPINADKRRQAPMLVHVALAPLLAQTGVAYLHHLDQVLKQVDSGIESSDGQLKHISIWNLAHQAAAMHNHEDLQPRERAHLQALDCMLRHDHRRAMLVLQRHLQMCPGDALALSLVLDLSHTVGNPKAALDAATSVSAYWNERRGGILRPSMPGYHTASAMISVGMAVGGRRSEAELVATTCQQAGEKLAGGVATWAMAHIFDGDGRTAEGISACANTDGIVHFECCGFLLFDSILSGYGVRFALDREERGRGRSAALRLYDNNFERVLDSTGYAQGLLHHSAYRRAPTGWQKSKFESSESHNNRARAFMAEVFGGDSASDPSKGKKIDEDATVSSSTNSNEILHIDNDNKQTTVPSLHKIEWKPSMEDVLTWLPPTPQFLCDATLCLFRLTLNGTVSCSNYRWENLQNAWSVLLEMNVRYEGDADIPEESKILSRYEFCPLVCVAASLMADPDVIGELHGPGGRLASALHKMGELLNLGGITSTSKGENDRRGDDDEQSTNVLSTILFRDIVADKEPEFWLPVTQDEQREEWKTVLKLLVSAIDGVYDSTGEDDHDIMTAKISSPFEGWDFDVRPFLEHAAVYAACKCGDFESLSIARSICSRGVTLRPNSPEEWWRYSIVLGLLGDEVASEDALAASHTFGGGQGTRIDF
jgi:hypothetical protein